MSQGFVKLSTIVIVFFCLLGISFSLTPLSLGSAIAQSSLAGDLEDPALKRALRRLNTYDELQAKLTHINRHSRRPVAFGPLIANGENGGLINIDVPLDTTLPVNVNVCGGDGTPNIREAVICTVNDGFGGNLDATRIGQSTQGRDLLAVRIGNPEGKRVYILTQQHGNEVASTEAALSYIKLLAYSNKRFVRRLLRKLDILIVLRANPDAGEPRPDCLTLLPVGQPFTGECAVTRSNLDPAAGGGFVRPTEPGFRGVVGQGYDLNRYHFVGLDGPIRPLENQAMVAAALVFQPDYVLDLHGDQPKTDCTLDPLSIQPGQILGLLPTAACQENRRRDVRQISVFAESPIATDKATEIRALAARVLDHTQAHTRGSVGRFSQIQLGAGSVTIGTTTAYQRIGAVTGGWETANFTPQLRPDVQALTPQGPSIGPNTYLFETRGLRQNIALNVEALNVALKTIVTFQRKPPVSEGSFCNYGLANGLIANLPSELWGPQGTDADILVPIAPSIGVPLFISGTCDGDEGG